MNICMNVSKYDSARSFEINGVSYVGSPLDHTVVYITKKIEYALGGLENCEACLVFAEKGIRIPDSLKEKHAFVLSDNPEMDYARCIKDMEKTRMEQEAGIPYHQASGGYYVSETARIGENAWIEPGCVIGPGVVIGDRARILSGAVIKHAVLGNDVMIGEGTVIGSDGFTMAKDNEGNWLRIPTLGRVAIGNHVEVGANGNISCGTGGDTILEDYVKISALVHISHDVHIHKNVKITGGCVIAGYVEIGEKSFLGVNSTVKNRISLGEGCVIGMGSNVLHSVPPHSIFAGNPAREIVHEK